jgi:aspartyl-tRNA(Asn)/glutamyl-tRNA(Gln) amidotransferase subunit A
MAGENVRTITPVDTKQIRLAIPETLVMDSLDDAVAAAFDRSVAALTNAGVEIVRIPFVELAELPYINRLGGFAASESYAWHKDFLANRMGEYDPRVGSRIAKGAAQSAADYITLCLERQRIIGLAAEITAPFDAIIMPTVAIIPPTIEHVDNDDVYFPTNMMTLRNTSVGNFLDRCSISVPCHKQGEAPVGFMLTGRHGDDHHLFRISMTVEQLLKSIR